MRTHHSDTLFCGMVLSIATPGFVNKFLSISSSNKENLLSWAVKYSMLLDREWWSPTKIWNTDRECPPSGSSNSKAHALRFGGCFADVVTGVRFFTVLWNLLISIIIFLCRLWYFPVYKLAVNLLYHPSSIGLSSVPSPKDSRKYHRRKTSVAPTTPHVPDRRVYGDLYHCNHQFLGP